MKRLSALLLGAVLLLSLAACGGGEGAASSGAASSQTGDGSAAEEAVPFTLPVFLEDKLSDVFTHNKAIQKIRESYQVSREEKEELGRLKRIHVC